MRQLLRGLTDQVDIVARLSTSVLFNPQPPFRIPFNMASQIYSSLHFPEYPPWGPLFPWGEVGVYPTGNAKHSSEPMTCRSTIPLAPAIGLNEPQHQRTPSFHSNMSYPMLRFLDNSDYSRGTTGYGSALPDPGGTSKPNMKATIPASLWQHILLWHDSINVDTTPQGSLRISCDWTTDVRWLSCSECENCERKCFKSGI